MSPKELFQQAHEELIEEYMAEYPDAVWEEAYRRTADSIQDRYTDKAAAMIDAAKEMDDARRLG